MRWITMHIAAALMLVAADDPWAKVQELKSGAELRIFKKDSKQPVAAKFDQVTEESVVVVLKKEQVAVPKHEIDRIDFRPEGGGSRITRQATTKTNTVGNPSPSDQRIGGPSPGPSSSSSSSLSIGSKPDFHTVYRRIAGTKK